MNKYEVVFETERIYFVKITEELLHDYLEMVNDADIQKNISTSKEVYKITEEQELEWIKKKRDKNAIIFSMIEKETNEYIGNIEIMHIKDNIGELGISITSKKQNKHFGQEAIREIINYAFNVLNLEQLELDVYDFNTRGIRCYEKVGFVRDGIGETEADVHMKISKKK